MAPILSLDISTKTGWAVMDGADVLTASGVVHMARRPADFDLPYPVNYAAAARSYATELLALLVDRSPSIVVVEETNPGHEVLSQRILEWIHMAVVEALGPLVPVVYIRTGDWRRAVGLQLTRDQAKANLSRNLAKAKAEAAALRRQIKALGSGRANSMKVLGLKNELYALHTFRTTRKHLAVWMVNRLYGMGLTIAGNDIADAILLGRSYFLGAARCDGKMPTPKRKTA